VIGALALLSLISGLVIVASRSQPASAAASTVSTAFAQPGDRLFVYFYTGQVTGHLSPNTAFTVTVTHDGAVKSTVSGSTGADGSYSVFVGYDTGRSPGVHNGDLVTLADKGSGKTDQQKVSLSGILEDDTGRLVGTTLPGATIVADLFMDGGPYRPVLRGVTAQADANGRYVIDFSTSYTPPPSTLHPAWRGFQANVAARQDDTAPNQGQLRQIQTVNTTVEWTKNLVGGGLLVPGDAVTFELHRGQAIVDTATSVADADGVPQTTFTRASVTDGDVLVTRYHDGSGIEHSQVLSPWKFTAIADTATDTVTGVAEPSAGVVARYYAPDGQQQVARGNADASGRYSLKFADLIANRLVVIFRQADPGFTGVGAQQIDMFTPYVGVTDTTGNVAGYVPPGLAPVRADVRRNGAVVATGSATASRNGKYSIGLSDEVLPGDQVTVTAGAYVLPTYDTGSPALSAHRTSNAGQWTYSGTGQAGRTITVNTGACRLTATVATNGTWSTPVTCALTGTELAQVFETATSGPAAGDVRGRYENTTEPDVTLTSPAAGATVSGAVRLSVTTTDDDDLRPPSKVVYFVDGKVVATATAAPFTVTVPLAKGRHVLAAFAYDALGRVDSSGKAIAAQTPVRSFSVS
jgi:hypothetical protein